MRKFYEMYIFILTYLFKYASTQCADNIACFAGPFDVSMMASFSLTANSTCGLTAPEDYCVGVDCTLTCDASNNQTSHPTELFVDAFEKISYWKSRNFDEPVFLLFDLGSKLILHQVTITFQFEYPNGLYIQKSQDNGQTFLTLMYYAIRCNDTFNLPEASFYDKLNVLCFKLNPAEVLKQVSYAPRRDDYVSKEVLKGGIVRDYFLVTNIKIILQEYFKPSDFNRALADRRKFYFAIRDIDVQASCYCNGMSNQCNQTDLGTCICQKNTQGRNCESCKSLYNNKPWVFGKACEACNCNTHAASCSYDSTKGFGICQNCLDNTMGDNCDKCKIGFYRNISILITEKDACTACNCDMDGVKYRSSVCEPLTGKCICKSNVEGDRCHICKDGYYGLAGHILNGCMSCGCSPHGTVGKQTICDKQTGQCQCKTGFTDKRCSSCKPRYFGFPVSAPSECKECDCNPAGSVNMTCDLSGQCFCRSNYYNRQCGNIRVGFFSPNVWQLWFSTITAAVSSPKAYSYRSINITDSSGNTFFVLGYVLGLDPTSGMVTKLTYTIGIPGISEYEVFLQYMTAFGFSNVQIVFELKTAFSPYSCDNGTTTIRSAGPITQVSNLASSSTSESFGTVCLTKGTYEVVIWFPPNSAGVRSLSASVYLIAMLMLPRYRYAERYLSASLQTKAEIRKYYVEAQTLTKWAQAESMGALYMSYLYGSIYDQSLACNCDVSGSTNPAVCNVYGGQCNCKQNIYGRTCSSCITEHYNFTSGLGCSKCDCDAQGSFNNSCDAITGQCPCKANVVGRACNKCALNYFGIESGNGCQACGCSILYSTSSACDSQGNCKCKPGVTSAKCTQCADGNYDLSVTGCKSCICNPLGTAGNKCNPTTGQCTCKTLVMGEKCERCLVGYYGYSNQFPKTCLKCHCTSKTTDCDVAPGYYITYANTSFSTRQNNRLVEGWTIVDLNGNEVGKGEWDWAPTYSFERGYVKLLDADNSPELFFSAPVIFLGRKRSSYMYYLTFDLTQQTNSTPRDRSLEGDVVIKGKNLNYKLVTTLLEVPKVFQTFTNYKVQFYEKNWKKDAPKGAVATNVEMLNTLNDLEYIYIRGKWTTNSGEFTGLASVLMEYSAYDISDTSGLTVARNVEYCNCPVQYAGQFCQECNIGFTRDPVNGGPNDVCKSCQCNGHSQSCNKNNGTCYNCLHNTMGSKCELCNDGFYGDATVGKSDDCKSCMCPGGSNAPNQFATKCTLEQDKTYTCRNCQTGYAGRRCERCSDGYYGNPMDPRGKCEKCTCSNNIDASAAGNCNTTTGECLRCLYNTIGASCEYCMPGYFGDALTQSCSQCGCNPLGSIGTSCQNMTGQCQCRPNVIGRICQKCSENTFNIESGVGCELCNCHLKGSKSLQCNLVTGKCDCNPRVEGDKCNRCASGYYDLDNGCLPCNCSKSFTVDNTTCDAITGQCKCRESSSGGPYSGRTCSECSVNAIGTPPNCELCHSPCYDNWQHYIDKEASDIASLQANVTNLLSKFGGMTYERIESELSWLNGNLTAATKVFSGARYNTSEKLEQFQKIETKIIDFEAVLGTVGQQLTEAENFFKTTVSTFNGSVSLSAQIPQPKEIQLVNIRVRRDVHLIPSSVDASYVMKMAEGFIVNSGKNNITGQAIYMSIVKQYNEIVSANTTISEASSELSKAMSDLAKSATERAKVDSILDTQYKAAYATNKYELKKIHDVVASIIMMQNKTVTIHTAALSTLKSAQAVINQAEENANKRRTEALSVSQGISQMKVDVLTLKSSVQTQQKSSADLKLKMDDVLIDVKTELDSLAKGVTRIAVARNQTLEIINLAYEIGNMSMPITLSEIQSLSLKIQNTAINEGMINATFADAEKGLQKAKEVQTRSKEALDVSESTLRDIQNLEMTLSKSSTLRQEASKTQAETDVMIQHIQNITSEIEKQYNTVDGKGEETLLLLDSAILQAQSNKMCFVNAKAVIDNATTVSQEARKIATESFAIHQTNSNQVPQYSKKINDLFVSTSSIHGQAQMAKESAEKLLGDVTEAEGILNEFKSQKKELEELEAETATLEAELNELLIKFDQERIKFQSCNRP